MQPWVLLRNMTHDRGFNVGDGEDDDIPSQFSANIGRWQQQIATGILWTNKDIVIPNKNGYDFLQGLIRGDHPIFDSAATKLIMDHPRQKHGEDLADFKHRTDYFLSMRGIISNISTGFGDDAQIDTFIHACQQGEWLFERVQFERQNPNNAHKYKANQLVNTLQQHLKYAPKSNRSFNNPYTHRPSTYPAKINQVDLDNDHSEDDNNDTDVDFDPEEKCSNGPFTKEIFNAMINSINKHPDLLHSTPCICCKIVRPEKSNHRFDQCDFCNDNEFCRDVFIETCRFHNNILKKQAARKKKYTTKQRDQQINAINQLIQDRIESDFPTGNNKV